MHDRSRDRTGRGEVPEHVEEIPKPPMDGRRTGVGGPWMVFLDGSGFPRHARHRHSEVAAVGEAPTITRTETPGAVRDTSDSERSDVPCGVCPPSRSQRAIARARRGTHPVRRGAAPNRSDETYSAPGFPDERPCI